MATLDQAFIKAYTRTRQAPAPLAAASGPVANAVNPPRIGMRSIGLRPAGERTAVLAPPAARVETPIAVAAPEKIESVATPVALPTVAAIAPPATPVEPASPALRQAVLDYAAVAEASEPFAVSLVTPQAVETCAISEPKFYHEQTVALAGLDQGDLLVWHPTTRELISSESDMMIVAPRTAPSAVSSMPAQPAIALAITTHHGLEIGPHSTTSEPPTSRAVVVPPPLPKLMIPPASEMVVASDDEAPAASLAPNELQPMSGSQGKSQFAPLSSFSPRLVGEVLRPQLEVDRFAWPEVCGLLLGRVEADFIRLAEELTARTADASKVVAWTGCQRGEGRTTSLLCMAQRLAALGQRCVLVDADFSRPELARRLGISVQVGWEEVVSGNAQLTDVLIGSIEDKIALLPRRQKLPAGTSPGAGPRASALFGMLREAFDVVLLDVGPMAGDAELADMASCASAAEVGGAYLVFDSRNTTEADMTATASCLRANGINIWGAIENFRR